MSADIESQDKGDPMQATKMVARQITGPADDGHERLEQAEMPGQAKGLAGGDGLQGHAWAMATAKASMARATAMARISRKGMNAPVMWMMFKRKICLSQMKRKRVSQKR